MNYFIPIILLIVLNYVPIIDCNSLPFCLLNCICFQTTTNCSEIGLERVPTVAAETTLLDLSFNRIEILNPNPFRHLSLLTSLFLNDNRIEKLTNHLFAGLARLITLHLNNNKIESIDKNSFKNLHNLKNLYLNNNRIQLFSSQVFSDLPSLKRIFLQNNRLTELSAKIFENNVYLEELNLENNSLFCNCQLLSLKKFSEKISIFKGSCDSPNYLENRLISRVSDKEFQCKDSQIYGNIKLRESSSADQISLECLIRGDPKPSIQWFRNDIPIDLFNKYDFYSILNNGSKLLIKNKTNKIEGNYRCIARNIAGNMSSEQHFIQFSNNKPMNTRISSSPIKSILKPFGSHLVLNCLRFENKFWTKNDIKIDEKVLSNRLKVAKNGSLIIKNLLTTDSAIYKCVDRLNHNIESYSLKISEPPVFTETPDSVVEVESGGNITLKCLASGLPEPQIMWTRKQRNNFRVINKLLILINVKTSDEDIYECIANNTLGIAVKEVKLKVKGGDLDSMTFESNEIIESISEAKEIVDQAINSTIKLINSPNYKVESPGKLMQLARFPLSPESLEFAKSIEIYEKSLEIIRRKAEAKLKLPFIQYKYENLLSPNQLNILAHLSGCLIGYHSQNIHLAKDCKEKCHFRNYRTYEGFCNNVNNHLWGASLTSFARLLPSQYEDGIHLPIGWFNDKTYSGFAKPNARKISQQMVRSKKITSDVRHSHMLMQHGQFLDHDIDFAMPSISFNAFEREPLDCSKTCRRVHPCFSIEIPNDDIRRNLTKRRHTSQHNCIELVRSSASCGSGLTSIGTGTLMPREQLNQLTAFIDGSNIYGSTTSLANHLRDKTPRDSGLMRSHIIQGKHYLPLNEARFPNDCQQDPRRSDFGCFLAGDIRANEQLGLLATHTLWLREHNRIARFLADLNPIWSGEQVYQETRKIVGSQLQFITYYQWLPHIIGEQGVSKLGDYSGYNSKVDPSVANVFATAALRFGHTLINPFLSRLNNTYGPIANFSSHLTLHKAFFAPHRLVEEGGIDPLLRGLLFAPTKSPRSDQILNNELTEHLFELARDVSLDLAAINIQRGRDHGLPDYNEWRKYCNMSSAHTFDDLRFEIKNPKIRDKLKQLYGHPNNIDLWVGAVSEDIIEGSKVGPTFQCLLIEQFRRLRDGDRFYFENSGVFTTDQLNEIKKTSLARVICDNGDDTTTITTDVFVQPKHQIWKECKQLSEIDLKKWQNSLMPYNSCNQQNDNDFEIPSQLLNQLRNG